MNLEKCAQGILDAFTNENNNPRKHCPRYERITPKLLEYHAPYKMWHETWDSALRFLHGPTSNESRLDISATTYSWHFPAASCLAQNSHQNPRTLLAYYCCHPHARAEKINTSTVLLSLIYQLLASRSSILENNKTHFGQFVSISVDENVVQSKERSQEKG